MILAGQTVYPGQDSPLSRERYACCHLDAVMAPLLAALHARDPYTGAHSERVAGLAALFAEAAGVAADAVDAIRLGALVHDVGKIGVPDHVLKHPGRLTADQFALMKAHPGIGRSILGAVGGVPQTVLEIVHFHHERVDGRGYPEGLRARQIPLAARLVAIADAWDAMTSLRSYRPPLSREAAMAELARGAGTQFDPELVDLFLCQVLPHLSA